MKIAVTGQKIANGNGAAMRKTAHFSFFCSAPFWAALWYALTVCFYTDFLRLSCFSTVGFLCELCAVVPAVQRFNPYLGMSHKHAGEREILKFQFSPE